MKKDFMGVYKKHYDTSNGHGSPAEWISAFNTRMGIDKAKEVIGKDDPYEILGINRSATFDEIKSAYRKMAMKYHPDRNIGDSDAAKMFLKVQAAYEILNA